ncbi:response regulator [Halalkalibacter sp. APA_J-10(15)]|uniref:response regulator n=1 Tax=Halalkalibacter sp. APA_J-10(15) TaxID=2933805 RepID=UPI001FF60D8B|nr:response regulator [Halalkalibacter sp. APA_J-10(15)]MCK0470556.1 response regulator [Halalkalibacter sp. APA_J-10(15)]
MIKVMLVDDESLEREGLELMLSKNRSGFEVVAQAQNGKQAVELARDTKPDLIFMDIKMPQLDGLQAIEQILAIEPNVKCIMVSAFDMFDYARQAMKFGIKEYLLKPSRVSEVLEAFDRMVAEIEEERRQGSEVLELNQRLERFASFIEMELIVSLMLDHVHEFEQKDWQKWLDLDQKQGFVVVFSFDSEELHPNRQEKSRWYKVLKQAMDQEGISALVGPLTGFQVPSFILLTAEDEAKEKLRQDIAGTIIHQVQKQLEGCRLLAGIGSIVSDVQHFSQSYEEAIYALELVYHHERAAYMVYNRHLRKQRKELVPFEVEKELVHAVKTGDSQQGMQLFDTYFQLIQQASHAKVELIKKAIENFFSVLARAMNELGFDEDVQMSFEQLETARQIKERAKTHLLVIIERLGEWRTSGVDRLLVQAKEYIDDHYHKAVTLEEAAERVGLSSYYLSKLFKEHFQLKFIEYVTQTRMNKAKDLLLDGKTPLKEIALTIGYKDPNYFSRVFKKETGMSPREYRGKYQGY